MSTFKFIFNGNKSDTAPMDFDPESHFGIVLPDQDVNNSIIKCMLRGVAARVNIRTPSDEEMENLPMYEITSPLFWDPMRKLHAEN